MKKWFIGFSSMVLAVALVACGNTNNHENHGAPSPDPHAGHKTENKSAMQTHSIWKTTIQKPNTDGEIQIQIQDHSGKPVSDFDINHEKKLHLIIVSEDLSYFNHVHPEFKGNGEFTIDTKMPKPGKYKLIADYIPKGGEQTTQTHWITLEGTAKKELLKPETSFVKVADGKEVTLSFEQDLKVNQETMLTFKIKDAASKQDITNLQPYLGAIGHVVILSENTEQYLHVHPMDEKTTGPDAKFHTTFPKSGVYKIWGQFQHDGKVFTVPFVVNVP